MKEVCVWISTRSDGGIAWEIRDAGGKLIGGGGTRKRTPPKDPIKTICKSVEGAMKRACLPGRPNPR